MNQQHGNNCNCRKAGGANTNMGFTMVEVVVALTILSTAVIAVFGAMSACASGARHARMLTRAVLLAETKLVEVKIRLSKNAIFETTQGKEGLYWWEVKMVPTPVENLAAIRVQVKWLEQHRQQCYELFSLFSIKLTIQG